MTGSSYLQTSLALEYVDDFITSGAIHAYVPAALILVVLYISLASPKSDIFIVLFQISSVPSIGSLIKTVTEKKNFYRQMWYLYFDPEVVNQSCCRNGASASPRQFLHGANTPCFAKGLKMNEKFSSDIHQTTSRFL